MKNLSLCGSLLCLLISCSADSDFNPLELEESAITKSGRNLPNPGNSANPFDFKGEKYYDALTSYWGANQYPNSIAQITDQISFLASQFKNGSFNNRSVIFFTDEIVQSIMDDPDNSMIMIVQNSTLSNSAKTSLVNFLQVLIEKRQLEFSITYNYITDYEDTVITSNSLNQDDSETILTVTSISRYSLYSETQRKDRDWDKSGANKNAKPFFTENQVAVISILLFLATFK
ncbi:hypothetical protein NJT12_06225 [Flavobacterium sp. AC]|uniref:Uncharacterized protein n=1 Tax=Flavobacterium azizsancarii TaxID=2961580 RepID=A0ABT4W9L0_9FLAO|nr:hypothetical protein [Flavobacterium azizsancarii]MDA6069211.1 hypothetical protein [Flavobacterium azizsancarii]